MQYKKFIPLPALALSLIPFVQQAHAAGFQLNEHSAAGLGRAFAGEAAMADDASVIARNPAAMSMLDRSELSVVGSYIVPDLQVEGTLNGAPIKGSDVAGEEVVPAIYFVQPIDEKMTLGLGIYSNFGLSTDYSSKSGITPIADKSAIVTVNINPSISYRITDTFSIGLGFNAVFVDAELSSSVQGQKLFKMTGDDWGYGWNIGALWEVCPNTTRLGITYRSQVDTKIDGKVKSDLADPWKNKNGYVKLDLPQIAELSLWQRLTDVTSMQASVMWIGWSSMKEISPRLKDGTDFPEEKLKWKDTWRYSLGLTHDLRPDWVIRAGVAYDESPANNKHRTFRIPDCDRMWYTLGTSWHMSDAQSFDFGYAYLHGEKVKVKKQLDIPNVVNLDYDTKVMKGNVQIFSVQYNHRF